MFHFPASTPTQTMHSSAGNTTQPVLGFPIRTSSDQRFVDNSPRLNAASHVLHRLSMPRHPPYALNNQKLPNTIQHTPPTKNSKRCAQIHKTLTKRSRKLQKLAKHTKSTHTPQTMEHGKKKDARVHYTVLTQHTHTTTTTQHITRMIIHVQANKTTTTTLTCSYCVLPQTPNSMPTHSKNTVCGKTVTTPGLLRRHPSSCGLCIHPEIFNTFLVAVTHTATSTTNTPTTVGTILKAP